MNVRFWNYGDYSSDNYGAHSIAFEDANGNCYWFSYSALIAFQKNHGKQYVHVNDWGTTTGKHLNWIDGGNKKSRLTDEEFKAKFKEVFNNEETLVNVA